MFEWRDSAHGSSVKWHIWVEDSENEHVYHSEQWILTKKMMREEMQRLVFTIPIFEPLPTQYYIRYNFRFDYCKNFSLFNFGKHRQAQMLSSATGKSPRLQLMLFAAVRDL